METVRTARSGSLARGAWVLPAAALLLSVSGCVALLVGGAAGGGYYVGKEQQHRSARAGHDADITARINARYAGDRSLPARAIHVSTAGGVVTLYGTVPSRAARARAVAIARETRGVRRVVSRLEVAPPR